MTAYPAWTPASRPGIVPLHPLSFGTILGRSFVALRQNPRVLLGFALVVQTVAYLLVLAAIGGVVERHMIDTGFLRREAETPSSAGRCPRCQERQLQRAEGCATCMACGYSQCG